MGPDWKSTLRCRCGCGIVVVRSFENNPHCGKIGIECMKHPARDRMVAFVGLVGSNGMVGLEG